MLAAQLERRTEYMNILDRFSEWLEERRIEKRDRMLKKANRRNIENLALGADKMRRVPMAWRQ